MSRRLIEVPRQDTDPLIQRIIMHVRDLESEVQDLKEEIAELKRNVVYETRSEDGL